MSIFTYVVAGLIATLLVATIREARPDLGAVVALAAGALILLGLMSPLLRVVDLLRDLAVRAHVDVYYVGVVLRIVGIAYLAQFAADVARDAGEGALAGKIEFAGKVGILLLAVPVILTVVEVVVRLLGEAQS